MAPLFDRIAPDCRDLARVIEELLARRRQDAARRAQLAAPSRIDRGWPKEWTRDELCDVVYSSYKALLKGAIRRPPRRQVVMELADYLECSLEERNRLLVAARYVPEQPYLQGGQLTDALAVAQTVIDELPLPAHSLTRDWDIHLLNDRLLRLLGIAPEQFATLPPEQRNVLQLVFDPELPLHALLSRNPEVWDRTARREVYGFKQQNQLCQYDDWYVARIEQLMQLPHFARYWQQTTLDASSASTADHNTFSTYLFELTYPDGTTLHVRSLLIALGDIDYPKVIAYIPADQPTRQLFARWGLAAPTE